MNTIGDRLKERREGLGMSQRALAQALGLESQSGISMLERGDRGVNSELLLKLANVLSCDPAWLLTGKEPDRKDAKIMKNDDDLLRAYEQADYLVRRLVQLALSGKVDKALIELLLRDIDT